jgi:hypothetical protein
LFFILIRLCGFGFNPAHLSSLRQQHGQNQQLVSTSTQLQLASGDGINIVQLNDTTTGTLALPQPTAQQHQEFNSTFLTSEQFE